MVKVADLLKSPFEDKQWLAKIAIGGVVSAVPILNLCAMGYIVSLIRGIIKKKEEILPEWSDWGKLFTDGILYFVILVAYMIIPSFIFAIGIFVGRTCAIGWALGGLTTFIAAIAGLAVYFVLPMVICEFVATDDFKSAFAWKILQEKLKGVIKEYGTAYLIGVGLFIAGYIACFLLTLMIIGWVLWSFVFFYLHIIVMRMFSEIYLQTKEEIVEK